MDGLFPQYCPPLGYLVDLHGQHEHQSLLRVSEHRNWWTATGNQVLKQRQVVAELYKRLMELKKSRSSSS